MHPTISRSLAVIMLSVTPAVTAAQSAAKPSDGQEPIPRELVLALLNLGPGMGGADIRVGKAPDNIPSDLLPPGFEILGSTTQFESSVIVLATREQPDSAVSRYEAHLLGAGWTKPPAPQPPPMRGFVSADPAQVTYDRPDMACRGEEFVTYTGTYRRNGGSLVKVTYSRGIRYSMCEARQGVTAYQSPSDEAPVPMLRAPSGSVTLDDGGMSAFRNDSFLLTTRLATRLEPGELVDHYDKQMRAQDWTSVGDGSVRFLAARTYRKKDDKGRPWIATLLSIVALDSAQQDVMLRISRSQTAGTK
jgi:hypothetical protein